MEREDGGAGFSFLCARCTLQPSPPPPSSPLTAPLPPSPLSFLSPFLGLNYFQSVTPALTLGGEAFWLRAQGKSGTGFAARHAGPAHVATAQVATTGLVSLGYLHRVSDKVSLATDFLWNWHAREASASFGYDYLLRQCRLRGRVDTEGRVAAFLEERVNVGVNFILSAEIDHVKKDYKFGLGMTVGE